MAVVNFRLAPSTLKKALDDLFNDVGVSNYVLYLSGTGVPSGQNCTFKDAVYDSVNKLAYVSLDSTIYFTIESGATITGINLMDDLNVDIIVNEPVTEKTYSANGTYTVSNLIINLGE